MTTDELNQHEQAADEATAIEPCDGNRRAYDDLLSRTHEELFSLEAIRGQCDRFNRAWLAVNGGGPRR